MGNCSSRDLNRLEGEFKRECSGVEKQWQQCSKHEHEGAERMCVSMGCIKEHPMHKRGEHTQNHHTKKSFHTPIRQPPSSIRVPKGASQRTTLDRSGSGESVGSVDLEHSGAPNGQGQFNTDNIIRYINGDFKLQQKQSDSKHLTSHEAAGSLQAVALYNYFPEKSEYLPIEGDEHPEFGLSKGDQLHILDMDEEEGYVLIRFAHSPALGDGWVPGQYVSVDGHTPFFAKSKEKRIEDERKRLAAKLGSHQFRVREGGHGMTDHSIGHSGRGTDINSHRHREPSDEVKPRSRENTPRGAAEATNGGSSSQRGRTSNRGGSPKRVTSPKRTGSPQRSVKHSAIEALHTAFEDRRFLTDH